MCKMQTLMCDLSILFSVLGSSAVSSQADFIVSYGKKMSFNAS